jgi:catechol 2,3-dioxygenase-like lactoylglutathione lyase family enzyme
MGDLTGHVLQLRVVVETEEFERALEFYRDALGMPEQAAFEGAGDARVVILEAGQATLELVNPAQRRLIDDVEVGRASSPRIRIALEVEDAESTTERLTEAGARLLGGPSITPWRSKNSRMDAPAGLQLTIFEELDPRT